MASCSPPPTRHNSSVAPTTLPEELLPARFVLICRDPMQPLLAPLYDGPFRVFFLLQIGDGTDKDSMLCLKPAQTHADTKPAQPPC